MKCVFCDYDKPLFHQTEDFIVFKPLNPVAAVHYLIVPKKHVKNYAQSVQLWTQVHDVIKQIADKTRSKSYRCVINYNAPLQTVFHAHLHFIGADLNLQNL